ncbi:OmpA family protein [Rhodobacteraceae bacterium 2CG4]|uniref:OmpA family protein n=1 Tax=Halovulum marinum TaxID=2662447 RepID=A0A6L5Z2M2_9RHOB|nr:OmpA family protein [Halovulum marinum]MSU90831.1 OmpA family protein [Halovulum marinum]
MPETSRRDLIMTAAAALAAPASAIARTGRDVDPWASRAINDAERGYLMLAGRKIAGDLGWPDWIETATLQDHYRIRMPARQLFASRSTSLLPRGTQILTAMAPAMITWKIRVEIVSHVQPGDDSYAAAIRTERRSEAVRGALMSRGVDGHRLLATGLGHRFPLAEATADGFERNERVSFLVRPL